MITEKYDKNGNLIYSYNDLERCWRKWVYNENNKLISYTDGYGEVILNKYDPNGELIYHDNYNKYSY